MTGLNLETLLRLLRADLGAWLSLAAVLAILGLMAWTSWGRRRALRKCLVLSIVAHVGLVVYGRDQAARLLGEPDGRGEVAGPAERIREIRIVPDASGGGGAPGSGGSGEAGDGLRGGIADWDRPTGTPDLGAPDLRVARAEPPESRPLDRPGSAPPPEPVDAAEAAAPELAAPELNPPEPRVVESPPGAPVAEPPTLAADEAEPSAAPLAADAGPAEPAPLALPPGPRSGRARAGASGGVGPSRASRPAAELASADPSPAGTLPDPTPGARPDRDPAPSDDPGAAPPPSPAAGAPGDAAGVGPTRRAAEAVALAMPDAGVRPRPGTGPAPGAGRAGSAPRRSATPGAVPLVAATPAPAPGLPEAEPPRDRALPEIPEVYRSRLAPDRSERALASGASPASERAVERALAWLARHQDADGRWDAGARKRDDGRGPEPGETAFTKHCPPGDACDGECFYYEADTAATGLALLAFLGAGHTHRAGPHAKTVAQGLNFLLRSQRADGDLRGQSRGVGMYCHAIASLALCEAYALTRDERLRPSVERAVAFLVASRAADGQSWRYAPDDPYGGDTSILGWAILVLKSAKEVGIPVPSDVREGALKWLGRIREGDRGGLAIYRPGEGYPITPTMTAEAWVCRQFLGVGGPGAASDEAASYLLFHNPDRDPYNLYYWYYATLAMYQHGGAPWARWNARVRDQLVSRQASGGHADGSWDPSECKDQYDLRGGRVYTTALAALTLEVYYRYLRLYDAPAEPAPPLVSDPGVRRSGLDPARDGLPTDPVGPRP
jgi:hypothetical protein